MGKTGGERIPAQPKDRSNARGERPKEKIGDQPAKML